MKYLYIIVLAVSMLIIILISGCIGMQAQDNIDYSLETKDLDSRQLLEYYFEAWNEKNLEKMIVASPRARGVTWELEELDQVKIISIEPENKYPPHESLHDYYRVEIFRVEFEIKTRHGIASGYGDGQKIENYQMAKKTEDSPWIVALHAPPGI